jgi:hypothetical protein
MRIARSTYYDAAPTPADDTAIVEAIAAIYNDAPSESWTTHLARRLWSMELGVIASRRGAHPVRPPIGGLE